MYKGDPEAIRYLQSYYYWDVVDAMTKASNYPFDGERPVEYTLYSTSVQPMMVVRSDDCPFYEDRGECHCYSIPTQQHSDPQPTEHELNAYLAGCNIMRLESTLMSKLNFIIE